VSLLRNSFSIIEGSTIEPLAMDRSMKQRQSFRKGLLFLLALIGSGTVLLTAGAVGLRMLRNHPPDRLSELISPDGRYRIVITEEIAGFPGSFCFKQVYVLGVRDTFDRNDEDNQVFAGACDGLDSIRWDGARIQGTVAPGVAVVGVKSLTLKQFGGNGKVQLSWTGR
jgi:hypothetical protein